MWNQCKILECLEICSNKFNINIYSNKRIQL